MRRLAIAVLLSLPFLVPAHADDAHHKPFGDGEVRRVDKDAQKITLRHGPLAELDMPQPMTMVYRVKDPAMLDKVKPGDKVRFQAAKINGIFTLTAIEQAR
jgi:Cu(I)/Ag(I) efflux system protein CusF